MAYLHNEPNVIIHRDLKPRSVHLQLFASLPVRGGGLDCSYLLKKFTMCMKRAISLHNSKFKKIVVDYLTLM